MLTGLCNFLFVPGHCVWRENFNFNSKTKCNLHIGQVNILVWRTQPPEGDIKTQTQIFLPISNVPLDMPVWPKSGTDFITSLFASPLVRKGEVGTYYVFVRKQFPLSQQGQHCCSVQLMSTNDTFSELVVTEGLCYLILLGKVGGACLAETAVSLKLGGRPVLILCCCSESKCSFCVL